MDEKVNKVDEWELMELRAQKSRMICEDEMNGLLLGN